MGTFRFLLALSVIAAHGGAAMPGFNLPNAEIAVQAFFIISGFYMALILTEKYTGPSGTSSFLINRFLRIYPPYLVVLFFSVLYIFLLHKNPVPPVYFRYCPEDLNFTSKLFLVASNIFIFGQDVALFFGSDAEGNISYQPGKSFHSCHLIIQGWSLAIELVFYLIAPFLVRQKNHVLLKILSASILLRVGIYYSIIDFPSHDIWSRRFVPTELAFFLIGILSFRLYQVLRVSPSKLYKVPSNFFLIMLLSATLIYPLLHNDRPAEFESLFQVTSNPILAKYLYFAFMFFGLPSLFDITKKNKVDQFLGNLSYPIYVNHLLVIQVFSELARTDCDSFCWGIPGYAVGSILFALLLMKFVINPIEKNRRERIASLQKF